MSQTKSWMHFLAGLGAGIVTGILLAPDQGQRIRERVGTFARQSGEAVKERAENLRDAAKERLDSRAEALRNRANDVVEDASAKADQAADKFASPNLPSAV